MVADADTKWFLASDQGQAAGQVGDHEMSARA